MTLSENMTVVDSEGCGRVPYEAAKGGCRTKDMYVFRVYITPQVRCWSRPATLHFLPLVGAVPILLQKSVFHVGPHDHHVVVVS